MAGRYMRGWSKDHQKIFRLYSSGLLPDEIVKETKFPKKYVTNIIRSDKFQEQHNKIINNSVETARKLLESKLVEAAGQITRIMKRGKPDERLRFDAAKEILYQCGMKPVEVIETRGRQYTPEELASSLSVMEEIQKIENNLSTQGSEFLIEKDSIEVPSLDVPVQVDEVVEPEFTSPQDEEKRGSPLEEIQVGL